MNVDKGKHCIIVEAKCPEKFRQNFKFTVALAVTFLTLKSTLAFCLLAMDTY